ncbi:MAG TPA: ABC transporter ATP-binding protein [Candidatus Limnocylindrales bacterium]|nr:ABC transporter ATP-binding protein [Candidatus Limnocylindrales bacterium]
MRGLDGDLTFDAGALTLRLPIHVPAGSTHVLLGESGAGKTTALRLLAGFARPRAGRLEVNGRVYDDVAAGIHQEPEARRVGMVFQNGRLFPHLSALANVVFPLRAQGVARGEAAERASAWMRRLGIEQLADRMPARLSGGEAQRVALARALVAEPDLLLLDEPMAALDVRTREAVRAELAGLLDDRRRITVLVTHDYLDAVVFADQVQVLEEGRVVQEGTVPELVERPRSAYVAQLAGMNVFRGRAEMVEGGACEVQVGGMRLRAAREAQGPVFVAVAPTHVTLHRHRPEGSARNVIDGVVRQTVPLAGRVRVTLAAEGGTTLVAEVTRQSSMELDLSPGTAVFASFKATEIEVYR